MNNRYYTLRNGIGSLSRERIRARTYISASTLRVVPEVLTGLSANVRKTSEDSKERTVFGSFLPTRESKVANLVFINHKITW